MANADMLSKAYAFDQMKKLLIDFESEEKIVYQYCDETNESVKTKLQERKNEMVKEILKIMHTDFTHLFKYDTSWD